MYPILGRYGSFFLYSYTVLLGLGVVAGVGLVSWQVRRAKRPFPSNALLLSFVLALLLGRLTFVWAQWDYFQQRPLESWQLWQGGLTYHGALLGGLAGLWLWWRWQQPPGRLANWLALFAPAQALLHPFGWAACLLEGCGYGQMTTLSWLAADLPDDFGVYGLRYQTQLLGLLLGLAILMLVLVWAWRDGTNGRLFPLTLLLTSLLHLLLTLLRGDPVLQWGAVRLDTILSALIAAIGLILLQYLQKK